MSDKKNTVKKETPFLLRRHALTSMGNNLQLCEPLAKIKHLP
jgi:hypothetical protein